VTVLEDRSKREIYVNRIVYSPDSGPLRPDRFEYPCLRVRLSHQRVRSVMKEGSGLWPVTAATHRHSVSVVVNPEDAVPASLHICIRLSPETEIYRAIGSVVTGS